MGIYARRVTDGRVVHLRAYVARTVQAMSVNYWLDSGYWLVYSVVAGSMVVPALLTALIVLLLVVWFVSLGDRR